jgi:hypothetical protein
LARTRPTRTPSPDQLTLDDWAEEVATLRAPDVAKPAASIHSELSAGDAPNGRNEQGALGESTASHHPSAKELLETPDALLTRTHLRELGLERRAIDAVFRALAVVALPGYSRPMVRVRDFLELLERCTFCDDRVRPIARAS